MAGGLLQGILAESPGGAPKRRQRGQSVAAARPVAASVPKDQWQRAVGRRLLTPAEEAAREGYFLARFTAAMSRFAAPARRGRLHPSAA